MYIAPVGEIAFAVKHVAGFKASMDAGEFGDLTEDLLDAILAEAGRFASEEIAPLRRVGDQIGAKLVDGKVSTPPGWRELYRRWIAGGWNGLQAPEQYGGQALPTVLGVAALEMWNSGSMAFGIGPTLTMGAIEAIDAHASEELKQLYLPKLTAGEWMGTMNLTEPHAGSDLAAVKCRAEPAGDGSYRLFGQKIFITYGEHDFCDNIIHLVLARLPDAPPGSSGLSLFLVPKFTVNVDGTLGPRNDVFCSGLEHKLGIRGSPTCTMVFGDGSSNGVPAGARGWLIGEQHRGLACMFTMMNNARLAVGIQGVAVAEAAFQMARAYATERQQGKVSGGDTVVAIVHHPDVQRNLLTIKAMTAAARAICYSCAFAIDKARMSDGTARQFWKDHADLLTPIAKAFSTDVGVEATSIAVQVFGGMGYIEETGVAALYRDARIAPIYEGTNGIQAIDLVTRKLSLGSGKHVDLLLDDLSETARQLSNSGRPAAEESADVLKAAIRHLRAATTFLRTAAHEGRKSEALAGAVPYLRLFALTLGGVYLARAALSGGSEARTSLFHFYLHNVLSEADGLHRQILLGGKSVGSAARYLAAPDAVTAVN
ncbi:acyl-CoA dehydrogenase [Mesorhizobium sp. 1B3]|uniref:acyl-CoA dehydrogenase n=1 Tax=Mesorhizobium sp. 1B3 TaxID=3243599 RepID=UPI003D991F13